MKTEVIPVVVGALGTINIVYGIEIALYGVICTRCLCQKPSLARTSLVRGFDTNNSCI